MSGLKQNGPHGPLTRFVQLRVAHAPGMPGTFSPSPWVSDPDMHHGAYMTHVPWCMPGSLTSGFLWNRWQGKRSRHSRRMHNTQFYVSGKRSIKRKENKSTGTRSSQELQRLIDLQRYRQNEIVPLWYSLFLIWLTCPAAICCTCKYGNHQRLKHDSSIH